MDIVDVRTGRTQGVLRINVSRRGHSNDSAHIASLGNPYRPVVPGDTLVRYERWVRENRSHVIERLADELQGRNVELACWCKGAATCHANVVARLIAEAHS